MKVWVLALQGVFDTGLSTMLDALATANELAALSGAPIPPFEVTLVGTRKRVTTALGLRVPVASVDAAPPPDWLLVPAIGAKMPEPLLAALARRDTQDAIAWLQRLSAQGVKLAAACIGTFVLAETGLLDGHEATTTWWLSPLFRQRYPRVRLDAGRMLVPAAHLVTAGAALSNLDLSLWLIRQASPSLAATTARYLVTDHRPSQSAYAIADHLMHADPLVQRFEHWARAHLDQGFQLEAAAEALATSKRTLARRVQQVLGKSPLAYVQDLRVERALHLLKTTRQSVDRIAAAVGYAEGVTLRALLRRRMGRGVRELRGHGEP